MAKRSKRKSRHLKHQPPIDMIGKAEREDYL